MAVSMDLITGALSFLLTLFVFSYLLGDNPLFRIATYLFVGVTAGYVASVAVWQVIFPRLIQPLIYGSTIEKALLLVPLILSVLLVLKSWPRTSQFGMPAMAYIVGVSAAVTVGGAVLGTLFPQTFATINAFDWMHSTYPLEAIVDAIFILAGLVTTLVYFHFGARVSTDGSVRRIVFIEVLSWLGRVFIAITLGVLYVGVFLASLTAFIERLTSWINFIGSF